VDEGSGLQIRRVKTPRGFKSYPACQGKRLVTNCRRWIRVHKVAMELIEMLIPLPKSFVKTIIANGDIRFDVLRGWEDIANHSEFMNIPHKIVWYKTSNGYHTLHLFDCVFTIGTHMLQISKIIVPSGDNTYLAKPILAHMKMLTYFYLSLTVDKAIEIAKEHKRSKLIISSELPGIADILVERDFIVKEGIRDRFNRGTDFRGSLKLRKPSH
jgi:hypothetical protein